jgi:hypothetical protein
MRSTDSPAASREVQQPRSPHLPGPEPLVLGGQRPDRQQPPDKALGHVGPLGNLTNAVRHRGVTSLLPFWLPNPDAETAPP